MHLKFVNYEYFKNDLFVKKFFKKLKNYFILKNIIQKFPEIEFF